MQPGVSSALANPTRFPERPNDLGELPFGYTNGPSPIVTNPSGLDGYLRYTGARDLVEGPDTVNGSINYGIFIDRARWSPAHTGKSMLIFIRAKTTSKMQVGVQYEAYSISALNALLGKDVNFIDEFHQSTAQNLMQTFKLFGVQQNQPREETPTEFLGGHFQNHHVARRARFPSYWSMIDSKKQHRGSVMENDELYLIIRRYELDKPIVAAKKQSRGPPRTLTHYWQIVPYVSYDRRPPPDCLWSDDDWVGGYIFVGYVHGVYGEKRAISKKHSKHAREALFPESADIADWKTNFYRIAEVEVFLATG